MRPLEIVLTLANLLAFCILLIPRRYWRRWMAAVVLLAPIAAYIEMLVEGPRWQMVPAHGLALCLLAAGLLKLRSSAKRRSHRILSGLSIFVGALLFAVSVALPVTLPVFRFPEPSGHYAIGTVSFHWTDRSRPELFTTDGNKHREIEARVWYPARPEPSAPRAPYVENANAVTPVLSRLLHLPPFFFSYLKYVRTHAVASAPVASSRQMYPVLIYLTGLGGFPSASMFQIQDLVSHGYIVVGLDQPDAAGAVRLPDGRTITLPPLHVIQPLIDQSLDPLPQAPQLFAGPMPAGILPYFAKDVSFAIDRLTTIDNRRRGILANHMNLHRIGIFGMSLGAMTAAQAALHDPRIRAVLMIDAAMPADVVRAGLPQPAMWISRPADSMRLERRRMGGWSEKAIAQTISTMRATFRHCAPGNGYYLEMPGMFHLNFTDAPYWSPFTRQLGLTGPVDATKMFAIVNAYTLAFFNKYLDGRQEPLFDPYAVSPAGVLFQRR